MIQILEQWKKIINQNCKFETKERNNLLFLTTELFTFSLVFLYSFWVLTVFWKNCLQFLSWTNNSYNKQQQQQNKDKTKYYGCLRFIFWHAIIFFFYSVALKINRIFFLFLFYWSSAMIKKEEKKRKISQRQTHKFSIILHFATNLNNLFATLFERGKIKSESRKNKKQKTRQKTPNNNKTKTAIILLQWKTPESVVLWYTCLFLGLKTQVAWILNDKKMYKENNFFSSYSIHLLPDFLLFFFLAFALSTGFRICWLYALVAE